MHNTNQFEKIALFFSQNSNRATFENIIVKLIFYMHGQLSKHSTLLRPTLGPVWLEGLIFSPWFLVSFSHYFAKHKN
jgi:hypothetical protein